LGHLLPFRFQGFDFFHLEVVAFRRASHEETAMLYKIGFAQGVTIDPERRAWRSDAPRPLSWAAWYPASPDAAVTQKLIGRRGSELFRMGFVADGAPLSAEQEFWPIVLLSHGTGGSVDGLCWLGSHLAARGFISVGVSHHGNTAIEPYLPEGFLCWWERALDLTRILDWQATDGPFAGRMDLGNVFAAGFSLGGYTVLSLAGAISNIEQFREWLDEEGDRGGGPREFPDLPDNIPHLLEHSEQFRQSMDRHSQSYCDRRIRAVAAFAPAPPVRAFEPASLRNIDVPVHITVGRGDIEAPADECALWLQQQNPSFEILLLGTDVGHYVFLPEATDAGKALEPVICRDPGGVDRPEVHRTSAEAAETLFRRVIDHRV